MLFPHQPLPMRCVPFLIGYCAGGCLGSPSVPLLPQSEGSGVLVRLMRVVASREGRLLLQSWRETSGLQGHCSQRAGQGRVLNVLEEEIRVGCSRFAVPCSPSHQGHSQMQQGPIQRSMQLVSGSG